MNLPRGATQPHLKLIGLSGLSAAFVASCMVMLAPRMTESVNHTLEAWGWRHQASQVHQIDGREGTHQAVVPDQRVVLVDIDNASVAKFGSWPWPREQTGLLLERLAQYKPSVIAVDIAFPDETSPEQDRAFMTSLKKVESLGVPLVLGQIFDSRLDPSVRVGIPALQAGSQSICASGMYRESPGYLGFFQSNVPAQTSFGHLGSEPSPLGWVRGVPAWVCSSGQAVPSFALQTLRSMSEGQLTQEFKPSLAGLADGFTVDLKEQGISIPINRAGNIIVPYSKPRADLISISAKDLLVGSRADANLPIAPGAILVLGSTAFGLVDSVATPLADNVGGFEVHAQLLLGILDGQVPRAVADAPLQQVFLIVLAMVVSMLSVWGASLLPQTKVGAIKLHWLAIPLGTLLGVVSPWAVANAIVVSGDSRLLWPWAGVLVFAVLHLTASATLEAIRLGRAYRRTYSVLGKFFASSNDVEDTQLAFRQGESKTREAEMLLLSVRMRNFSRLINLLGTAQASQVLQRFYEDITEVSHQHGGVVLEFLGDTVICGFPCTVNLSEDGEQPLPGKLQPIFEAANRILEAEWLVSNPQLNDICLIASIEKGTCLIGVLGHNKRKASVVVGAPVSTTLSLLELCTENSEALCLGQGMAEQLGLKHVRQSEGVYTFQTHDQLAVNLRQPRFRHLGQFLMQGALTPMDVWAVRPPEKWIARSEEGLRADTNLSNMDSVVDISE
jgi:adenylate cyclase